MNNNTEKEEVSFLIRSYLKVELAQLYFPTLSPASALKKLRKWIARNPELKRHMSEGLEGRNDQSYSHRQVLLLVKYLEVP